MKINWKSTGQLTGEFWCIIRGTMCMMISTADGPLYYATCTPGIRYSTEEELLRFINSKHRAAWKSNG